MQLSVVFPVYNEAGNVEALVDEVVRVCDPLGREYEIVVVDDGSDDGTPGVLRRLKARVPRLRVVLFRRNFGQTAALQAGISHARGDVLVTMDGDGENDPADIPKLLSALETGVDMVCGWRQGRWQGALFTRRLPSAAANRLIGYSTGIRLHDYGCQFKAFRRELASSLKLYGEMHRFVPVLAHDIGASIVEVPVGYRPRRYGASKYGLSRMVRVILDLITVKFLSSFKTRPIQVFGLWGLIALVIGLLWTLWLIFERQVYGVPMGNRPQLFLAVLMTFTGMQFITLGLLGEMLSRTYHESQNKPPYVVREVLE
ncbi:MAG TPA: glycosyltransferase family 2 protein [Candidatus Binatia bacterium]|nr:glycosyltransferase family 2 protein [Candidatus Binatia bacterium]